MKLFKEISVLCLLLILFSLIGCSSANNRLPNEKPKDFNFTLNYGVNAKNQLNTTNGQYTKDMVNEPSVTTNLKISDEEMKSIYLEMKRVNILHYPDNFNPKSNMLQTPFQTYSLKIIFNGKEKNIYWKDESVSEAKEAVQLRQLFTRIQEIVVNKEEYKKLPAAKGGYD